MLRKILYVFLGLLLVLVSLIGILVQRWVVLVQERATFAAEERAKVAGRKLAVWSDQCSSDLGALELQRKTLRDLLDAERKAKARLEAQLAELRRNFSKEIAVWSGAQQEWRNYMLRYEQWTSSEAEKYAQYCAISDINLGIDARFTPKADELRHKLGGSQYPTFEQLYELVINKAYDENDNVWQHFPNAYNMSPSFVFPFSNLADGDIDRALQKLGRPPAFIVEVGSFHGNSAVLIAKNLDRLGLKQVPLLCIDPWTGDLGELLYRDDWEKVITPGEIKDGRSTSYYQFMVNIKAQIDSGKLGPRHIIPLAITSVVGARYLKALGLTPDLVYLDSAHEKDETFTEMTHFYSLLAPGGILLGDDYSWDSVSHDVTRFAKKGRLEISTLGNSWMLQKPQSTGEVPAFRKVV